MRNSILFLFFCFLSLNTCIKEITFPVDKIGGQLVIDALFTDDSSTQVVRIGRAAFQDRVPIPVQGAVVSILNGDGEEAFYTESNEIPGTYLLPFGSMPAEVGQSYQLRTLLTDGSQYESAFEQMPAQPGNLEQVYYKFENRQVLNEGAILTEELVINIFADVDLSQAPSEPYFLRWDVEEVYKLSPTDFPDPFGFIPAPCYVYVYTSGDDLQLYDGRANQAARLTGLPLSFQEIDETFVEKHWFSVYQRSLTPESFDYFNKIDQLLANTGTIFDTPPAPVPGNFHNLQQAEEEILGYFTVASSQVKRFATFRHEIPIELLDECLYQSWKPSAEDYPRRCLRCETVRNSTFVRPDFF
ncbi:MAG TPA: DUF4249 domain-containing protein [Saprospiraceae bacterium]|nr:DUF4249 domain-containing protein [Saprospiraceae bacterium]